MRKQLSFILLISLFSFNYGQNKMEMNSSEIYESIQKLNFLGSVLYVAAHPDDENTNLISYFSNSVHARTGYVSMTRGDGGQNLIGPELRELLGVIRTRELLQARSIDGGVQFFTRANDFGYSKNPDETFQFWDRNQVLSDLVYIIRKFQPDIIIDRFDHRTPGKTHGHHTASAMLSVEAFDLAGDPNRFPDQLKRTAVWQPKRLFFNDSWFMYGSIEAFKKADRTKFFEMEIGKYFPALGVSNSEIAASSRSQHSSQGFGSIPDLGGTVEYLEPLKGGMPKADIFEGIDTGWTRVKNGKPIGELLSKVKKEYDFKNPAASVPDLMKAYEMIQKLDEDHWKQIKSDEIKKIVAAATGLVLEVITPSQTAVADEDLKLEIEVLNRSNRDIFLNSIDISGKLLTVNQKLEKGKSLKLTQNIQIPKDQKPTSPYWLDEKGSVGMYRVDNPKLIGLAENPNPFEASFHLKIEGKEMTIDRPLLYKFKDPTKGEVYKPFAIVPQISLKTDEKVMVFGDENPKSVKIDVKSFLDDTQGRLSLKVNDGWKVSPEFEDVKLSKKGEIKTVEFMLYPPKHQSESLLTPEFTIGNQKFDKELIEISYSHIPDQKIVLPAESKIVHIDLKKKGDRIAYIEGAGDSLPENLKQIGYEVQILSPNEITAENLKSFDAVVLGVRTFNVVPELKFKNKILFEYVKNGGNLMVQYNTNQPLVTEEISPLPLKLSRDRVTDEFSEVRFLAKDHPVLNSPNKIIQKDFEGWVQERGLYFPNQWDAGFTPVLSMNDKGESPMDGSLLVAKYGKGYYIYTGLSFFRELPACVPGAYRLLANILSLGK